MALLFAYGQSSNGVATPIRDTPRDDLSIRKSNGKYPNFADKKYIYLADRVAGGQKTQKYEEVVYGSPQRQNGGAAAIDSGSLKWTKKTMRNGAEGRKQMSARRRRSIVHGE